MLQNRTHHVLPTGEEYVDAPFMCSSAGLAHVNTDRVEAAMAELPFFDQRRRLMANWAVYIT